LASWQIKQMWHMTHKGTWYGKVRHGLGGIAMSDGLYFVEYKTRDGEWIEVGLFTTEWEARDKYIAEKEVYCRTEYRIRREASHE
jgi:hypothetical protein